MTSEGPLAGQVALVTGASSGIGRAIATELLAAGALVCAVARRGPAAGSGFAAYPADLTDEQRVTAVANEIVRDHGGVDVLVHAAGIIELGPMAAASLATFDRQHALNVRAPYALTQALLGSLVERRGQVVFINSSAGLRASADAGAYGATKHALRAVADSLRDEVNELGIRVTTVYVGRTASPMQARVHAHEGRPYHPERLIQPGDVASVVRTILCLPRTAEVTDVTIRPARPPG